MLQSEVTFQREENVNETRKQALEFFLEFSRLREHPDRKISPQVIFLPRCRNKVIIPNGLIF